MGRMEIIKGIKDRYLAINSALCPRTTVKFRDHPASAFELLKTLAIIKYRRYNTL